MTVQFLMILITILIWGAIVLTDSYVKNKLPKRKEPLKVAKLSKRKTRLVREATLDEMYFRCKELSEQGEVTYFSLEDIWSITEELRYKK